MTLKDEVAFVMEYRNKNCKSKSNIELPFYPEHNVEEFLKSLRGKIPRFIEDNLQMKPSEKIILFGKFCKLIEKESGFGLLNKSDGEGK